MKTYMTKRILLLITLMVLPVFTGAGFAQAAFSMIPTPPVKHQFSFEIKPGEEKTSSVIIENLDKGKVTLRLYGADGTQSNQGTFALTSQSTEQRLIGKWITFTNPVQTLDSREKKEIPFTIKIPANATPGSYTGGIAAETGEENKNEGKSTSVNITSRFVVKMFIVIPGQKIHKYEWTNFSYLPEKNGAFKEPSRFTLSYSNTGNTIVSAEQKIEINGFPPLPAPKTSNGYKSIYDSKKGLTFELVPATLLQKNTAEIPVKWDNQPIFGFYKAKATVSFSEYDVISGKKINTVEQTKEINIFIPLKTDTPLGMTIFIIFLITLGVAATLIVKKIRLILLKKSCITHSIEQGETLVELAEKHGIKWKNLARINGLKAPYSLKTGQKILVPPAKKI